MSNNKLCFFFCKIIHFFIFIFSVGKGCFVCLFITEAETHQEGFGWRAGGGLPDNGGGRVHDIFVSHRFLAAINKFPCKPHSEINFVCNSYHFDNNKSSTVVDDHLFIYI